MEGRKRQEPHEPLQDVGGLARMRLDWHSAGCIVAERFFAGDPPAIRGAGRAAGRCIAGAIPGGVRDIRRHRDRQMDGGNRGAARHPAAGAARLRRVV
jgi:hypothetical protein